MKQLIIIMLLAFSFNTHAQQLKMTKDSNYVIVDTTKANWAPTGRTVTIQPTGEIFELFITKDGKLFYWGKNKRGKEKQIFL